MRRLHLQNVVEFLEQLVDCMFEVWDRPPLFGKRIVNFLGLEVVKIEQMHFRQVDWLPQIHYSETVAAPVLEGSRSPFGSHPPSMFVPFSSSEYSIKIELLGLNPYFFEWFGKSVIQ